MQTVGVAIIGNDEFLLDPHVPFVFGRRGQEGVIGLDPSDMGISGIAGSVEYDQAVWWVLNRSSKRRLFVDLNATTQRLECGQRLAVTRTHVTVLVPGLIFTHRIDVVIPETQIPRVQTTPSSSGTITGMEALLTGRDRLVTSALFAGYLAEFPRRRERPNTYEDAAQLLGPPWTKVAVRKQIERLKERLARGGVYVDGPQGNFDLADFLIGEGLLSRADLELIRTDR